MRLFLPVLAIALAAALLLPASAPAKLTVGVSENNPAMFSHPLFGDLDARHVRVVMAYNVMTSGNHELARVTHYLHAARAAGIRPLVSFEHATGDATVCKERRHRRQPQCRLPTKRQYRSNVRKFLRAFPWVRTISPWNEINHYTQPTSRNPKAAAGFTNIVAKLCSGCTIVAADVLDQADGSRSGRPRYTSTRRYIARFRRALRTERTVCGIHNYSDVNRVRSAGTRALIAALGCRRIWLTETGGLFRFASFWTKSTRKGCRSRAACQLKATRHLFGIARREPRVRRVYVYTFFGNVTPRFDSGLVDADTGRPRRAYREVARRL
jgi:hypothetical protein